MCIWCVSLQGKKAGGCLSIAWESHVAQFEYILKLLNKREMHVTTSLYAVVHLMPCLAQLFPTLIPNPKDQVYKGLQGGMSPALPLDFLFGAQISRPVYVYLRLWT